MVIEKCGEKPWGFHTQSGVSSVKSLCRLLWYSVSYQFSYQIRMLPEVIEQTTKRIKAVDVEGS